MRRRKHREFTRHCDSLTCIHIPTTREKKSGGVGIDNQQRPVTATSSKPSCTESSLYVLQSSPFPVHPTDSQHKNVRKTLSVESVLTQSNCEDSPFLPRFQVSPSLLMLKKNSVYLVSVRIQILLVSLEEQEGKDLSGVVTFGSTPHVGAGGELQSEIKTSLFFGKLTECSACSE